MDAPYRCSCYVTQPNGERISSIPLQGPSFHHDRNFDSGGLCSSQLVQGAQTNTNSFSFGVYQTSPPQASPLQSRSCNLTCYFDILSNIGSSGNGFDIGDPALDGNTNNILDFSRRPAFAPPLRSQHTVPQDFFEDWETDVVTRSLLPDLDTYVTPNPPMLTQFRRANDRWGNDPWDGVLTVPEGPFPLQHGGYNFPSLLILNVG
jgi:hypothetical protein